MFKFLFKSKFLGSVEAPVGVLVYVISESKTYRNWLIINISHQKISLPVSLIAVHLFTGLEN